MKYLNIDQTIIFDEEKERYVLKMVKIKISFYLLTNSGICLSCY